MTQYAGIDYSTHAIDLVLLDETGQATYHRYELHGPDALARTRQVREQMPARGWWADQGVVALGIEEPMGRGSVIGKLKAVQGAVLACLPAWLLVEALEPARWRRVVGLPGNASKGHVRIRAVADLVRNHGTYSGDELSGEGARLVYPAWINAWPQDACDAFCLALAVSRLTEGVAA